MGKTLPKNPKTIPIRQKRHILHLNPTKLESNPLLLHKQNLTQPINTLTIRI